jgi:uncharacterized protein
MLISLVLGGGIGVILGLTGAGGGSLAVPALVFGLGLSVPQATPIALLAVAGSALVGTLEGFRRHLVRYRAATLMAAAGIVATPFGVMAAHQIPERVLLCLFALVLGAVAVRTFQQAALATADEMAVPCQMDLATGRLRWTRHAALVMGCIGAATGFLSGLLGVGGGFVMIPALRRASDIPIPGIVATSLMVMTLVSTAALLAAVSHGATLPAKIALPFAATAAVGMMAGRLASRRLPIQHVQRLFAALLATVAAGLLLKAASLGA